jgi:hypothetical protein
MVETIVVVLLALFFLAAIIGLGLWMCSFIFRCEHNFETVDDGTERWATYVCAKCGRVKRIKLR